MTGRRLRIATLVLLPALAAPLLAPTTASAQYFGKNKIQFRDFDWRIYHSPHFDVYYYTDEEVHLQKVVSFAESAYDNLSQQFDYQIQDPTPLVFYETHAAFEQNNVISNFIPEGLGAFASSVRNRMFLPIDMPDQELMELILHELTHIFQYHMLFGGSLGKGVSTNAPLWFTEGMASYMQGEESARNRMFVRDAVVNDLIPPVTSTDVGGFFAYRFGYAVFEYIEDRWGREGIRDFMLESRNTLGARMGRAVERAFRIEPEDFDADFRRWLRQRYLRELVETGEPGDFGRRFRADEGRGSLEVSPAASPSGDLVAAFSTAKGDRSDVVLYDTRKRTLLRNLTKGYDAEYQYLVAQELTLGRKMGRDLAFSPDGNMLALFGRKNRGRELILIDVLKGRIRRSIEMPDIDQQFSPAFNVYGDKVAFSGYRDGKFDIFEIDLATEEVRNVTDDTVFDGSPVYSPDGRSMVLTSVVGGYRKLFRIDLDNPSQRFPLTRGESNDIDAVYSPDGSHLYFTSDRTGANNIFSLDLESGAIQQHTNSVTGCFTPTVLTGPEGNDRIVYTAYWKGRFDLYRLDVDEPITPPKVIEESQEQVAGPALSADELPRFEPSIEVTIDDSNKEKYGGRRFFLEDVGGTIGVSDDQTFIAQSVISFSDYLGDRRIIAAFQSIESFQNFDAVYLDLSNRLQWQVRLFDDRDFFRVRDSLGRIRRAEQALSTTGVIGTLVYPFNTNYRAEFGGGYILREIDFVSRALVPAEDVTFENFFTLFPELIDAFPPDTPLDELRRIVEEQLIPAFTIDGFIPVAVITPRDDDFPILQAALVGDTAVFAPWGAVSGRRWRISSEWAPDLDDSGTLTQSVSVDFRQYLSLTRRSNLAFRAVGFLNEGNFPTPVFFGGLDSVRGVEFRSLAGDRGFYSNLELRFPLIDQLRTPFLNFQGIRGIFFLDIGGAWFDDFQDFDFYDSTTDRLEDAVSSYGFGATIRFFGLDLNFDFAKRWDFEDSVSSFDSSFWIGTRF